MISSILSRQFSEIINVLWIPSNDAYFERFIKTLPIRIFSLEDIYLGSCVPDIIISNNKTYKTDTVIELSIFHHCGLIFIDHEIRSDMIDIKVFVKKLEMLPNILQIALSDKIKKSWNDIHDIILPFDNTKENRNRWLQIIRDINNKAFIYE